MNVSFVVDGQPVPKARARAGRGGVHYTPEKTRSYERRVGVNRFREEYLKYGDDWPMDKRYRVTVCAYFSDRRNRDLDNVLKSVLDGLNKHAYHDDRQVDDMRIVRAYDKQNPRVSVLVEVIA